MSPSIVETCGYCGKSRKIGGATKRPDFHDPCIRSLPGVRFACCGHGESDDGHTYCYVAFDDGLVLYGNAAKAAMEMLGGNPPPIPPGASVRLRVVVP